jgi:uncharacterized RDD family membrane protein YckC
MVTSTTEWDYGFLPRAEIRDEGNCGGPMHKRFSLAGLQPTTELCSQVRQAFWNVMKAILLTAFVVSAMYQPTASAQNDPLALSKPTDESSKSLSDQLDDIVKASQQSATPQQETELATCQSKLKTWEDWATQHVTSRETNTGSKEFRSFEEVDQFLAQERQKEQEVALDEELLAENQTLREKNQRLQNLRDVIWPGSLLLVGAGVGLYMLHLGVKKLRKMRPLSQARKQLFVLLGAAIWVTFGIVGNADRIEYHPTGALIGVFLWSLPVVFLAGILLWWFSQASQTREMGQGLVHAALSPTPSPASTQEGLHLSDHRPESAVSLPPSRLSTDRGLPEGVTRVEHQSSEAQGSTESQQRFVYGTMRERLGAFVCDLSVAFLVLGLGILFGVRPQNTESAGVEILVAYMVLFQAMFHTTIGKYAFGLELRSAKPGNTYPSFWAVLVRETLGRFVSNVLGGLGYWVASPPQRQAWSDRLAATFVVRRTTPPRFKAFVRAVVTVSLLFTIAICGAYVYSLVSRF